jgi:hypothetical protein
MSKFHHNRLTLGVIPGWQVHGGILDGFLPEVFRGIQAAVRDRECNKMLAYGIVSPRGVFAGDDEPGPSTIVDNAGGIRQAFEHLRGHGHRQVAYIAGWADRTHGDSASCLRANQNGRCR